MYLALAVHISCNWWQWQWMYTAQIRSLSPIIHWPCHPRFPSWCWYFTIILKKCSNYTFRSQAIVNTREHHFPWWVISKSVLVHLRHHASSCCRAGCSNHLFRWWWLFFLELWGRDWVSSVMTVNYSFSRGGLMTNSSMLETQAKTQTNHMLGICINQCM